MQGTGNAPAVSQARAGMRSTSRRTWRRAARGSAPPRGANARQGAPAELRSKKARSRSGKPRAPPPPPRPMASPIGYDASSMRWNPKTCTRLCRGRPGVVVPCACRARRARHRGRRRRSGTTARARRRRASVSVAPCVAHARVGAARRLCRRVFPHIKPFLRVENLMTMTWRALLLLGLWVRLFVG